jgi:hypothetical protein
MQVSINFIRACLQLNMSHQQQVWGRIACQSGSMACWTRATVHVYAMQMCHQLQVSMPGLSSFWQESDSCPMYLNL